MNDYTDLIEGAHDGWSAPYPLGFTALTGTRTLFNQAVRLCGWNASETVGAPAGVILYNSGTAGQGEPVAGIALLAGAVETQYLGDQGIFLDGGLSADAGATVLNLIVYVRRWMG